MKGIIYSPCQAIAKEKLRKIIVDYARMEIKPVFRNNGNFVYFENGDVWRVVQGNDSARGYRWNVAYIDADIDIIALKEIILPSGRRMPYQAINWFNVREDNIDNIRGIYI